MRALEGREGAMLATGLWVSLFSGGPAGFLRPTAGENRRKVDE